MTTKISEAARGVLRPFRSQVTPWLTWHAHFAPGGTDKFGELFAHGLGKTQEQATLQCMHNAEVDFGWHGSVTFVEYKVDEHAPF